MQKNDENRIAYCDPLSLVIYSDKSIRSYEQYAGEGCKIPPDATLSV